MKKFILLLFVVILTACKTASSINLNIENAKMISHVLPIVDIQFGDRHGLFLVDTGSNSSFLSTSYLKSYGCFNLKENTSQFSSVNAKIDYNTSEVLVNINNKYYIFKTISMTSLNAALKNIEVIGILGSDFLRANQLIIDYKTRSIHK